MKNYLYLASVVLSLSLLDQSVQAMDDDNRSHHQSKQQTGKHQQSINPFDAEICLECVKDQPSYIKIGYALYKWWYEDSSVPQKK
ncbi:MAG: hypothetical protein H0X26_07420 [Alphaproteobacteria bacterium]|nr:hypothetical protein [Alphaproteobacteria bacterium]